MDWGLVNREIDIGFCFVICCRPNLHYLLQSHGAHLTLSLYYPQFHICTVHCPPLLPHNSFIQWAVKILVLSYSSQYKWYSRFEKTPICRLLLLHFPATCLSWGFNARCPKNVRRWMEFKFPRDYSLQRWIPHPFLGSSLGQI